MYFMQSHSLNHQQTCWALFLQDFNFKLDWLPGSSNPADFQAKEEDSSISAQSFLTSSHLSNSTLTTLNHPLQPLLLKYPLPLLLPPPTKLITPNYYHDPRLPISRTMSGMEDLQCKSYLVSQHSGELRTT